MKALTVDFMLIAQSMRDVARESNEYFLEKATGKVISLSRDLIRSLTQEGFERRDGLPAWDAQMIPIARKIVLAGSQEFIRIPEMFGRPEHKWRLAFTDRVRSPKLKEKLTIALKGRGSCKRFKEILIEHETEYRRWSTYHQDCWKEKISRWLESVGILAFDTKPKKASASG